MVSLKRRRLAPIGDVEIRHSEGNSSGKSFVESVANSSFYSQSTSHSITEALVPDLMWLPTSRLTLDEQLMEREHTLSHLGVGQCVVTLPHAVSFDARVNKVRDAVLDDERLQKAHDQFHLQRGR